jgi:transmembrane 9 superfamily protein 2/4
MLTLIFLLHVSARSQQWAPTMLGADSTISAYAGSLRSPISAFPYRYSHEDLFCLAVNFSSLPRSIGHFLTGEEFITSPYSFTVTRNSTCAWACERNYTSQQRQTLISLIDSGYRFSFQLDNVPLSTQYPLDSAKSEFFTGFEIGFVNSGRHYLYNLLHFKITLTQTNNTFRVAAFDLASAENSAAANCGRSRPVAIEDSSPIPFQYSTTFEIATSLPLERLDRIYNRESHPRNRTSTFVNAALSVFLSVAVVGLLLYKAIGKDNQRAGYDFDSLDGDEWKFVHGDVYRPPADPSGLAVRIGWGVQLLFACFLVLANGILGRSQLTNLSGIVSCFANSFVLAAPIGGFVAGKLFKTVGNSDWRGTAARFAIQFAAMAVLGLALLYAFPLRIARSSAVLPIFDVLAFSLANFAAGFVGILIGLKSRPVELSQKVNQLPRQIPPGGVLQSQLFVGAVVGLYLFVTIIGPFHMLMVAAWSGSMTYYDLPALLATFVSAVVQAMLAGVIGTFWQLNNEDYRWWWRSFSSAGTIFWYFLGYAAVFWLYQWKPVDFGSVLVFAGVALLIAFALATAMSAASFVGSCFFVLTIYNSLKME